MSDLRLEGKTTALVAIDLQRGVLAGTVVPHAGAEIVQRTRRLAEAVRAKGGVVVYVRVDPANFLPLPVDAPMRDPSAPPPPPEFMELAPEAGFADGDLLITKRHWGAFAGTELEAELRARGVTTVVLTGVATNVGVESTARQGTGLGFGFVIVEDACGARDAADHRYVFEKTFPRLARVRSTDEVVAGLG